MTKIAFPLTLLATVLVCALPAAPAQALSDHTFVSGAGSDANPCSFSSPCKTFQGAFAKTAANGVIDVLDPAEYGALTITKAISIQGHGWASVTETSGDAIVVNAGAKDKINIRGVLLDGVGAVGGDGIGLNTGANLNIQDSTIRNFAGGNGIYFAPTASSQLYVSNTLVSDNGTGIYIFNGSSGTVGGVLDHVSTENNASYGIAVFDRANVMVRNSTSAKNGTGLHAVGSGAVIRVTRSTITGNITGWSIVNGGSVLSYADNNIDNNTGGDGAPPLIPYK